MIDGIPNPGAMVAATVQAAAALGFVPVAIHFNLFPLLVGIGAPATAEELLSFCRQETTGDKDCRSAPNLRLIQDTMFTMAGLGFVDLVDDDTFAANDITRHIVSVPSVPHGMLHCTTEPLLASAFFMRKLVDSNFEYPLKECDTPSQYAYKLMGDEKLANEHTYPIMHAQGRMASFNAFMEGKFGKFGSMPDRVRGFGYDLDAAVAGPVVMVDIGGGKGEVLLELKQAYPHLQTHQLVLQEFNAEIKDVPGLTMMDWDYKSEIPQAVRGALMYSLTHIFHNLPDLDALQLMRKISDAMALHSKLLIHEFPKNKTYGKMHAAMIVQYGGRERSSKEWHQMAMMAGLKVTFEKYPMFGEGLVEMRKIDQLKEQDVIDEAYRSGESSTERVCAERGRSL